MVMKSRGENAAITILPDVCQALPRDGFLDPWKGSPACSVLLSLLVCKLPGRLTLGQRRLLQSLRLHVSLNCHPFRVGPISDSKTHQRHNDYINYNYKNSASPSCPTLQAAQSLFTLVHIILTTALRQVLSPSFKKKKKRRGKGEFHQRTLLTGAGMTEVHAFVTTQQKDP